MAPDLPRLVRVLLASLAEPGLGLVHRLLAEHEPERIIALAREDRLPESLNAAGKLAGRDPLRYALDVHAETERLGARVLVPGDPEWPERLDDLAAVADGPGSHGPPFCLWAKGPLDLGEAVRRSVAVVGSRDASAYGRHMAHEFGYGLASRDWTVVSGGALGIDSAAHQGALHAEGPTAAVLACGIDVAYPAQNERLFAAIGERGLVLSEWPPGACPLKHRFLIRNRLIAAATLGTVVVEATVRSGARNTARHAVELERPLMVMPGPVNARTSLGVHELAREPAGARIVTRAAEIIEDLGALGTDLAEPRRGPETVLDQLDELAARLLDAVPRRTATLTEQIAAQAGVPVRDARRTLPRLLMLGLVAEEDGRYRQAPAAINPARVERGDGRDGGREGAARSAGVCGDGAPGREGGGNGASVDPASARQESVSRAPLRAGDDNAGLATTTHANRVSGPAGEPRDRTTDGSTRPTTRPGGSVALPGRRGPDAGSPAPGHRAPAERELFRSGGSAPAPPRHTAGRRRAVHPGESIHGAREVSVPGDGDLSPSTRQAG